MPTIVVKHERMDGTTTEEELSLGEAAEITLNTDVITVEATYDDTFWTDRPTDPDELRELSDAGLTNREIADRLGVDQTTVSRWLHRCGIV